MLHLLALAALVQDTQTVVVMVSTKQGHVLTGTTDIATVKIESSLGVTEFKLADLNQISTDGAVTRVQAKDGTNLSGKLLVDAWKVKTSFGERTAKAADINYVGITLRASAPTKTATAPVTKLTASLTTRDNQTVRGDITVTSFKIDSTLGSVDVATENVNNITYGEDAVARVTGHDGTVIAGKLSVASWKVKTASAEFDVKPENIAFMQISAVRAPVPTNPNPTAPNPPPTRGPDPTTPTAKPAIEPLKTHALKTVLVDLTPSPDRKLLYVLDATAPAVLVLASDTLEKQATIALTGPATAMSMAPGGKTLFAAGQKRVSVIDAAARKVTKSFEIENDMTDVYAFDDQTLYATTPGNLAVVSVAKQSIVDRINGPQGRWVPTPDRSKLYTDAGAVQLPTAKDAKPVWAPFVGDARFDNVAPHGVTLSPDGRFAVSRSGGVYRTGKSFMADMLALAKVEPHTAALFLPGTRRLLLFTSKGTIQGYDADTFEGVDTWDLGLEISTALSDDGGKTMILIGAPATKGATNYYDSNRAPRPGDLYRFAVPP